MSKSDELLANHHTPEVRAMANFPEKSISKFPLLIT